MKKRILSLAMALCLLFTCATALSSCKKDGEVSLSRKTVDVDVSEYNILYADAANGKKVTSTYQEAMRVFAEKISNVAGKNISSFSESKSRSKASDPEILIGLTSRAESQAALESIKGDGFTVQVIGNKIVLIGTTSLLTLAAVEFFENTYLQADANKTLTLHEKAMRANLEMITLADSEQGYYSFVYGADYDPALAVDKSYDTTPSGTTTATRYAYTLIEESITYIKEKVSTKNGKSFTMHSDASEALQSEFAFGLTSRPIKIGRAHV